MWTLRTSSRRPESAETFPFLRFLSYVLLPSRKKHSLRRFRKYNRAPSAPFISLSSTRNFAFQGPGEGAKVVGKIKPHRQPHCMHAHVRKATGMCGLSPLPYFLPSADCGRRQKGKKVPQIKWSVRPSVRRTIALVGLLLCPPPPLSGMDGGRVVCVLLPPPPQTLIWFPW